MKDPVLTVSQISQDLKVCKMTVYRLIHAGELDAVKVGRSYRVTQGALQRYLRKEAARDPRAGKGSRKVPGVGEGGDLQPDRSGEAG